LYTGFASQLVPRIWQHKNDVVLGFTHKYHVHDLVYFELCDDISTAIFREKKIKASSYHKNFIV
jgi:putative endonuclease